MITINKEPKKYNPSGNPIIFQLSGSSANLVYFTIEVYTSDTDTLIYTGNIYPTPNTPTIGTINLSNILNSIVSFEVDNNGNIYQGKSKNIKGFYCKFYEVTYIDTVYQLLDTLYTTSTYYVFDSKLSIYQWTSTWNGTNYIINGTGSPKFLTNSIQYKMVNEYSVDQLYFLNDGLTGLTVNYNINGTSYNYSISGSTYHMYRINSSPKKLISNGVNSSLFVDGINYSVTIKSGSTNISETKWYTYESSDCYVDYVNLFYSNSLGGIDSIQMVQPVETTKSTRSEILKNNLDTSSGTPYINDGVYNRFNQVYSNNSTSSIKMYTQVLNDQESKNLVELINSKEWYMELVDGNIIPVKLINTDYTPLTIKQNNGFNQYQFEFELDNNMLLSITGDSKFIINGV